MLTWCRALPRAAVEEALFVCRVIRAGGTQRGALVLEDGIASMSSLVRMQSAVPDVVRVKSCASASPWKRQVTACDTPTRSRH